MKTRKLMNFILTVLLSAALFTLPVLADDEPVTLEVPTVLGETDVTVPYVYVIGEKDPGVRMILMMKPRKRILNPGIQIVLMMKLRAKAPQRI